MANDVEARLREIEAGIALCCGAEAGQRFCESFDCATAAWLVGRVRRLEAIERAARAFIDRDHYDQRAADALEAALDALCRAPQEPATEVTP